MKNIFRQNKVVVSWAVSYIIILFVTAVFNFYTYIKIEDNMLEQIDKINIELLQNRKIYIDDFQIVVNNLASQIAYDPFVQDMILRTEANEQYKYNLLDVCAKIESWHYSDVEIDNMYIYFHNTDYIAGGKTNTRSERYYNTYYSDKAISYDEYIYLLKQKSYGKYVIIPNIEQIPGQSELFYFVSVFGEDYSTPLATVVIEIKTDQWTNFSDESGNKKTFLIFDKDQQKFIFGNSQAGAIDKMLNKYLETGSNVELNYVNNNVMLSVKSDQNNWVYIYSINNKQYTSVINTMRVQTGGMMLLWLFVGSGMIYAFVKHQHKPIRQLINRLEKNEDMQLSQDENTDEFNYINEWITQIIKKKNGLESKREIQDLILRDAIFLKLMTNSNASSDFEAEESLENLGIVFKHQYFAVAVFYFEDLSEIFFETNQEDNSENYDLAKLIVANIIEEIMPYQYNCLFCDIGGMLCCILNMGTEEQTEAYNSIKKAEEIISKNFNIEFISGMSLAHKGLNSLMLSYQEAMQCIEQGFVEPGSVIVYDNTVSNNEKLYYFPIEKEINMIDCLRSGDFETTQIILDEILNINLEQNKISIQKAKCLMYDIICAIMKVRNNVFENDIIEQDRIIKRIEDCTTVRKMRSEILDILRDICSKSAYKQSTHISEIVNEVKTYINSYYDDTSLNVAAISKHFYMNQSYLSSVFKKTTNQGMLEYINETRVNKAKELLKTTDWSVEVIAENIGYSNLRTFTRIFSKYTGMPPGKYRDKNKYKD